ncbi:MAG: MBL fold metallo-hydrolase [Candidatus Poseidoniaceae archaeon]|nr:MBL fold metallo-hydrolase [Candidatus Poseidoniaceae archaeon]
MVEVTLLGVAQDGGRPQAGCTRPCCVGLRPEDTSYPVALGISDGDSNHLIEATRFLGQQLTVWGQTNIENVLLTHAHFGHVDGLGLFGKETMNARNVGLHLSSEMEHLVDRTPQWSLMVDQGVFQPTTFHDRDNLQFSPNLTIQPVHVPHRDELSDMHAFVIRGPNRSLLFLPDHDTWAETLERHNQPSIRSWLETLEVDIALIDGTFWSADELAGRNQDKVPHPPISQTIDMLGFKRQGDPEIIFIHLNHTNPVYDEWSEEHTQVVEMGWKIGKQGMRFSL